MKSRMLIEMMSALAIVLLTTLPPQTFGQGSGGGSESKGGIAEKDYRSRPPLSYTVDDKLYLATRVHSFRYVYQSFRPRDLSHLITNGPMSGEIISGGMGMGGSGYGGYGGGGTGMPGGFGSGGSPGSFKGKEVGATGGFSEYGTSISDRASDRLTIIIHAYLFDGEKRNDRTRIELMIEQPNEMGMVGMSAAGGMQGGMSGGYGGAGMMEMESIKRRLELLLDELKRRKLAKDRVVEVQLGRLILDAQGLLNNDR